ncbi:hypothetical protein [Micromonospora aurantiaca (nom. illeg.)]|uniref:hypothetical protein n=1 Tax=Micromonospora aurantiaca (nom. illeg.) TaxID=47850 RepID=UPI0033F3DBA1
MQPQYPTQPMMPQFPQQPAYPQAQPQYPTQGYPQQPAFPVQPAYAPQQYAQPAPQPPLPQGTLDGFFEQPSSGGGPSWKFNGKPIGTSYAGIVARTVTNADVRAQTNNAGVAQTYKDGRPKLVMVVPMQVQPSPEYPDGVAGWWVKGQARDELARAMAEAGAPAGAPEAGAAVRVTLTGQRAVPNMNPQLLYRVEYMRPAGAAPAPAPTYPGTVMQPLPAPAQQTETAPVVSTATGQPVVHQQPMPQPAAAAQAIEQPAPAPAGFNADQAALFAKLTGQPAA